MKTRAVVSMIRAFILVAVLAAATVFGASSACAQQIDGVVQGGGSPIANSTVTLWDASAGAPKQLAQGRTGADGRFALNAAGAPGKDAILYWSPRAVNPLPARGAGTTRASR